MITYYEHLLSALTYFQSKEMLASLSHLAFIMQEVQIVWVLPKIYMDE